MNFGHPFLPMLLTEIEKPFDDENYLYEIKFDGIRATIHVEKDKINIYSRHKKDITNIYPELINIKNTVSDNYILDGEIIILENGIPSFTKLEQRSHLKDLSKIKHASLNNPVCFIAFDCLYQNKDLANKPLIERKKALETIPDSDYLIKAKYILKEGKKLFSKIKKLKLEGIVAKNINSTYKTNCRTKNWLKIKNIKDSTFYIGGYKDEKDLSMVRLFLGEYQDNKFHFVGKVMVGKKQSIYNKLFTIKKLNKSPFVDFQEKNINYISPILTCEISFLERTKNNHLRHPVFKR